MAGFGLSSYKDYIDKELVIGEDIQLEANGAELTIKDLKNYISKNNLNFPSSDMYSDVNIYPLKNNYKYIVFKYKIWQRVHSGSFDNVKSVTTDTGYYYYQAIPIDKFGKSDLKIKYTRG